jgi:copper homeostasis protein
MKLELIAFTIQSCIDAEVAGAHRIELCDNPADGGTTPSYGFIKAARKHLSIDLFPIIRPRGGDFLYSDEEFEMMQSDIRLCRELGCDGVVIGMLQADGSIDKKRCSQLVELAYPMGVTFHRAFDRTNDLQKALEDVMDIGCERILTSGGFPNALDGAPNIRALIEQANNRIIIMPGSGVRSDNIVALAGATGAKEFHSSARTHKPSSMQFFGRNMKEELREVALDQDEAKKLAQLLSTLPV